jgi:hypothetical protein
MKRTLTEAASKPIVPDSLNAQQPDGGRQGRIDGGGASIWAVGWSDGRLKET